MPSTAAHTAAGNAADNADFYRALPALTSFAEAAQGRLQADLPPDWWIVIADVAGSTKAIEAGAYKDVNTVGVACIAAVVNVDRSLELPYVFGGDGATFAVPGRLRDAVLPALRAAQKLARQAFNLHLRVGLVRVGDLVAQDQWVKLGKLRISAQVTQPVLYGRGWEEAERRVKSANAEGVLRVMEVDGPAAGSFAGFECRWQGVPSFNGHKLALLVAATAADTQSNLDTYGNVLRQIDAIYGDVAQYHPLRVDRMRLALRPRWLSQEWRVHTQGQPPLQRLGHLARMVGLNLAGRLLFALGRDTESVRWSRYREDLVQNSDFRKFDGMLRMVIDGSDAQAARLAQWLESESRAGRLAYGMHKSSQALLTCIVQSYNGQHQHFVDGSEGGYALAARQLKQRLSSARASPPG
ncbi:DUF3095 domain-containing protein [Janthinobacterium sp. 17J80-10]|uniref:DUF3095 domain-containing protein n=1 Tax=Janthinobacterium sp. 17J80-10 TaxID=2497863 RepID=UPI0010057368|nr:DUF3095 domain-containing protein [Janthinobacterium sp. 17J80-10]QAU32974.1 DUF3095 domain-containing protein [Janthinobacterium sp. 17J80-10]